MDTVPSPVERRAVTVETKWSLTSMANAPLAIPINELGVDEVERAQGLARRYHAEFVDLKNFRIQHELFKTVPVDMMFRYNFVPLEQRNGKLAIAVSDPSKLMMLD